MKPVEETVSMDEPYRLSHEVHKPIIQNVREYIQPFRNIVQTLKPVIEDIRTIVPKDSDVQHNHQQPTKHQFGGIAGSINRPNDWNPVSMPRKAMLRPPPPRPSPANQLQSKFNPRKVPIYDSVKGSESQPRIQRRMQLDESHMRQKVGSRRGQRQNGKMQFGSSELVYVPMLPNMYESEPNRNMDNHRLGDYFASKGIDSFTLIQ